MREITGHHSGYGGDGIERSLFVNRRAIYFVQGALLLSNVMAGIDSTNVNTALPAIIADLHGLRLMGLDRGRLPAWNGCLHFDLVEVGRAVRE